MYRKALISLNMICKTLSALAVTIALLGSAGTTVAAKNSKHVVTPSGSQSGQDICRNNPNNQHCHPAQRPGHTQPACKGPHMGPNGVMIQCQ